LIENSRIKIGHNEMRQHPYLLHTNAIVNSIQNEQSEHCNHAANQYLLDTGHEMERLRYLAGWHLAR
jgi:hypothetical protein